MTEKEFDGLRELLVACYTQLEGSDNGYDPNSPHRENWLESRDKLLEQIELALISTAEEIPY